MFEYVWLTQISFTETLHEFNERKMEEIRSARRFDEL